MRKIYLTTCLFFVGIAAQAQLLFADNFNYGSTAGSIITLSNNRWVENTNATTTNVVQYDPTGSLVYPNLSNAGGKLPFLNTGQDICAGFSSITGGNIYAGMLVNFSAAQTTGDYFFHFMQSTTVNTFLARVFVKLNGSNINFGLMKNNGGTTPYSANGYALNTTYCIVVKYAFNTGSTTDDVATLYVFDAATGLPDTEPSTNEMSVSTNTDATAIGAIALRQGAATAAPSGAIDNVVVSTSWTNMKLTMPLQLKSLNCIPTRNALNIAWQTCNEINFDYFELQKSLDGRNFSTLTTIKGKGNNGINNDYTYFDLINSNTKQYYRLKLVDKDGSYKYSQIVFSKGDGSLQQLSVYPNPAVDIVNIAHPVATDADVIKLYDWSGRLLKTILPKVGSTQTLLPTTELLKGTYIVEMQKQNTRVTTTFVK
jgi:hypothetical protein